MAHKPAFPSGSGSSKREGEGGFETLFLKALRPLFLFGAQGGSRDPTPDVFAPLAG